jgi:hypothetical protein
MIQGGDGVCFALESITELRGGNFDGDVAIQAWIVRLPHLAHAPLANVRKDFKGTEFVAYGNGHPGITEPSLADHEAPKT